METDTQIPLLGPDDLPEEVSLTKTTCENIINMKTFGNCNSVELYKKIEDIGEGSSAAVYKASHKDTKEIVALKKLKTGIDFPSCFVREIQILKRLKHENIVQLKDVVVGTRIQRIFLVLEYCDVDVGKILDNLKSPLVPSETKNLMQQMLTGLTYLHDNGIIHRDISPANLLLTNQGTLKVTDFNSARLYSEIMTPNIGTPWYRAAELLFGFKNYTSKVDMWSVGCVLGELLKNTTMFAADSEMGIITRIVELLGTPSEKLMPGFSTCDLSQDFELTQQPYNMISHVFKEVSPGTIQMLKSLLLYNSAKRPSAAECKNFPYFQEQPLPCNNVVLMVSINQKKAVDVTEKAAAI